MIPRWHILLGALFTLFLFVIAPDLPRSYLFLVFFASVLIDFDHYMVAVKKTGKLSLFKAFEYYKKVAKENEKKKNLRAKDDFQVFHTIEFHLLIALLGIFWTGFFYIFIGMMFHSLLDVFWMVYTDRLYAREFFLFKFFKEQV